MDSLVPPTPSNPPQASPATSGTGLHFERRFTREEVHPYDEVTWERRTAAIANEKGETVFEQQDCEVPAFWSQMATNVVVSKYFRGPLGTPRRETSVKQMISRVVDTIAAWGRAGGYFATEADAHVFQDELCHLILHQKMSFNSPVWFNLGVPGSKAQVSACFIQSVDDTMDSILTLAKNEGMLFKYGSGTGTNLSPIRSSEEALAGGGTASGPVSFMKGFDAFAGVIKSGGTTRRAAKMVILNADHPDIEDFITCKVSEERKAWTLIEAGYDGSFTGEAYASIFFQNSNNSVRVTDEFMRAVEEDKDWNLYAVTDRSRVLKTVKARELLRLMAESAWQCGDPGVQYDTTINDWHTSSNTARINASNPCAEYMFLDDSACFAPSTRISTPDGLRTVEELYEQQERGEVVLVTTDLHSEHDHRRITAHRPALVTRIGRRPVFRTKLKDGRVIRTTGDHRVLTADSGWKRIDQLEAGVDRISIRESGNPVRFRSSAEQVTRWQMLGWLSGDGVFSKNTVALVFGPKERDTAEFMTNELNLLKAAAGNDHRTVPMLSTVSHARNGVMQSSTSQRTLVEHLEMVYGFHQGTAIDKDVPTAVHRVDDDLKVAYLQGLFSADGCLRTNQWATEPEVMLASSSPAMLRSVQLLLSDFGITSRISWTHPAGRANPQGQLHIYNQQARAFLALIGFPCSAEKEATAWAIMSRKFNGALKQPRCPRVVEVAPDGDEIVYDVTEPVTHSVIAEGLIAHNCNLASINLLRFLNDDGSIDVDGYRHAIQLTITAQEIMVSNASYPTEKIGKNSEDYRPLGLGYANLGALLMARGLAYDSPQGRDVAACLTAVLTGEAYAQSARIAREIGPFNGYPVNRQPMLRVIGKHREAAYNIPTTNVQGDLITASRHAWDEAHELGARHGYRNGQATVLAPTGTISFLLDCDTTGVEPDIALVKYKKLVGGGMLKIVNQTVPAALRRLGYGDTAVADIVAYIDANDTIEGAPSLHDEDVAVFDCAFTPQNGKRSIAWQGHVRMMAAVQPFISGAISKTVNMPGESTIEDVERAYIDGWKLGLKALAIYRDGSKRSQPLATSIDKTTGQRVQVVERPLRRRLPSERQALTHRFEVGGHEGYITVGLYEDGTPGEIFLKMAKEGSTVSGLMDSFATAISLALQYGVPLQALIDKFSHTRFEPQGFTKNPEIPIAKSVMDYIFRWLASRFLSQEERDRLGIIRRDVEETEMPAPAPGATAKATAAPAPIPPAGTAQPSVRDLPGAFVNQADAPSCSECGSLMVRNGACYKCFNCGATSGCS
ncbi:MAG TPA: LAGLIDADG family homing endonuclease [Candidatus Dormibacteraeota bacterium]